ncbi:hypothetical protein ES288_D09G106100v1 [Gossypium darwinii]|nr:hypothetical protein ES288_D09G106100v1 [Gossypium darwinii]TYH53436.1 hypothetical protein ES332_D09G101000v1 [Gossypium tomentosum]
MLCISMAESNHCSSSETESSITNNNSSSSSLRKPNNPSAVEVAATSMIIDQGKKRPRPRDSSTKHPIYKGVRMRSWGKWVSEIRQPRKKSRIWLGTFRTAEMAARAHDVASLTIKGDSAALNFPDLAELLPRPVSLLPRDIQAAAVKAASMVNLNRPSPSSSSSSSLSESSEEPEELSEIVELPNIEGNLDSLFDSGNEFVLIDSVDVWVYDPSQDFNGGFYDQTWDVTENFKLNSGSFETFSSENNLP